MVWVSQRFGTPQVRTYAQALEHYESVTPIRGNGRNGGKRPIGKRNGLTYMTKDEGTNKVCFWLYKTPVLTYNPDDTISLRIGDWISNTTATFITEILNTAVYHRDSNLHLVHYHGAMRDVKTHIIQDGMTIKYNTDQHGQVDIHVRGSQPAFVHRLNRQRWKEVRDKFKPFREYITLMSAMSPEVSLSCAAGMRRKCLDITSRLASWQSDNQDCVMFLLDVNKAQAEQDIGGMLDLFKELAINYCPVMWRRVTDDRDELTAQVTKEPMLKGLDDMLKHCLSRELFVAEFLPEGKYTKDSNKRYVKYTPREVEYNKLKAVI